MTTPEARAAARAILGTRVRVYRKGDLCTIARQEMLVGGSAYHKVYGTGSCWQDALREAEQSYLAMRANPNRGVREAEA